MGDLVGNWSIAGEDILTIVRIGGGLVSIRAGSGGISSSWLKVSAACTFWADVTEILIGTGGLGLSGGDKSSDSGKIGCDLFLNHGLIRNHFSKPQPFF